MSAIQTDLVNTLTEHPNANIAAAATVTVLYAIFMLVAIFNFIRERPRLGSHFLLALFGAIRVVAFAVRADLAKHLSEDKVIVYEVFFAVGTVALFKIVYSLLFSWALPPSDELDERRAEALSGGRFGGMMPQLVRNNGSIQEKLAFAVLIAGVVCSIIGATDAYGSNPSPSEYKRGLNLLKAGYTIFLVVIGIFVIMCFVEPFVTLAADGRPLQFHSARNQFSWMSTNLKVIGLLLTCKSVFQVISVYCNVALAYKNHLFYPLEVLPELLVMMILVIPGLMRGYLTEREIPSQTVELQNPQAFGQGPSQGYRGPVVGQYRPYGDSKV